MKNLLRIFIVTICVNLISCSDNEKFIIPASKVSTEFGASNCNIATYSSIGGGKEKSIKFTFTDPHMRGISQPDGLTSMAALSLLREMRGNELKDYDEIIVELETDTLYTQSYQIQKLRIANDQINDLAKFFRATRSDDSTALNDFFDKRFFPDSVCSLLYHSVKKMEREFGTIKDVQFSGFSFTELEETDEPVVAIKSNVLQGTKKLTYIFHILEKSGKIARIQLKA